jgi:hypothetical protein
MKLRDSQRSYTEDVKMVYPQASGYLQNAFARQLRVDMPTGCKAVVAVARPLPLPAPPPARAAHPHTT